MDSINIQIPSPEEIAPHLAALPLDEQFRQREIMKIKKQKVRPSFRRTDRGWLFSGLDGFHMGLGSFDEFRQAALTVGHEIGHSYLEGDARLLDWRTREEWCESFAKAWLEALPEKTQAHLYLLCDRLGVLREVEDAPILLLEDTELWEAEGLVSKILKQF